MRRIDDWTTFNGTFNKLIHQSSTPNLTWVIYLFYKHFFDQNLRQKHLTREQNEEEQIK